VGTRVGFRATITEAFAATVIGESGERLQAPAPYRTDRLPEVGDIVGGHYRLVRVLGQGMFGKVYVAERVDVPAHQVALKLVPREVYSGRNVERELVMLAAASHPHIVQLKDHGMTAGYVWLTMPVYEGETLANRLERGPLGLEEAYDVFLPIARALDALHKAGLRHQDIKPENIFLARFAGHLHPILLDLGVAAEREAPFVAGTILYASPEQLSALSSRAESLPLSDKMDTYCLASTLLFALVGSTYFPGEGAHSRLEIVKAHDMRSTSPLAKGALIEATGTPRKMLSAAFCRWMDPDPLNRPPVRVMADELEVLLEPEREQERRRARRRIRFRYVGRTAVAALLAVAAGGAFFAYSKRQTLRLASELNRARAEGAASFGELDTCIASHQLAQRDANACRDAKSRQEEEYRAKLRHVAKSGGATEASFARQLQAVETTYTTRIKSCEEEKASAVRTSDADRAQLTWDFQRKETQLQIERDEQHRLAETRTRELDRCRGDLATLARSSATVDRPGTVESPAPPSGGETAVPGSGPGTRHVAPTAPMPPPYGPPPAEGTLNITDPASENTARSAAAATHW
jgi:eukaryotic-like serine/threonine-protein kinase